MENWIRPQLPYYEVALTFAPPRDGKPRDCSGPGQGEPPLESDRHWMAAPSPTTAVLRAIDESLSRKPIAHNLLEFEVRLANYRSEKRDDLVAGVSVTAAVDPKAVEELLAIHRTCNGHSVKYYSVFMVFPDISYEHVVWTTLKTTSATEAVWLAREDALNSKIQCHPKCSFYVFEGQPEFLRFAKEVTNQLLPGTLPIEPRLKSVPNKRNLVPGCKKSLHRV